MFNEALKVSNQATKNTTDDSSVKNSVRYTENNIPVAVIDKDILKGVPQNKWVKTVKDTIANNYKNGIPVSGRLIKVKNSTQDYMDFLLSTVDVRLDGMKIVLDIKE